MRVEEKIKKLIERIIPPADYHHREGFTNFDIIDGLTESESSLVENALIDLLKINKEDTLIVQTFSIYEIAQISATSVCFDGKHL